MAFQIGLAIAAIAFLLGYFPWRLGTGLSIGIGGLSFLFAFAFVAGLRARRMQAASPAESAGDERAALDDDDVPALDQSGPITEPDETGANAPPAPPSQDPSQPVEIGSFYGRGYTDPSDMISDRHGSMFGLEVTCLAFSPDKKFALSGGHDGLVRYWDLAADLQSPPERSSFAHRDSVDCVTFSHDGKLAISGSSDETIRVWDLNTGQQIGSYPNPNPDARWGKSVTFLTYSNSRSRIVVGGGNPGVIRVWGPQAKERPTKVYHIPRDHVLRAMVVVKGSAYYVCDTGDALKLLRLGDEVPQREFAGRDLYDDVVLSPDGRFLAAYKKTSIWIWNTRLAGDLDDYVQEPLCLTGPISQIESVSFDGRGRTVLAATAGLTDLADKCRPVRRNLFLWELPSGRLLHRFGTPNSASDRTASCAILSHDGLWALSGGEHTHSLIRLWKLPNDGSQALPDEP